MPNPSLDTQNISDIYVRNNFSKLNDFFAKQGQVLDFKFMDVTFLAAGTRKLFHGLGRVPADLIRLSITGAGIVSFTRADFDKDYLVLSSTGPARVRFFAGAYFLDQSVANFGSDEVESWFSTPTLDAILAASNTTGTAGGLVPSGAMFMWPSAILPDGYLFVLGQTLQKSEYLDLFNALGNTWNTGGESSGEFRLPPAPGRSPLFAGTGTSLTARVLGQSLGEENHTMTLAEIFAHDHGGVTAKAPVEDHDHNFSTREFVTNSGIPAATATNRIISTSQAGSTARTNSTTGVNTVSLGHQHTIPSAGSSTPFNVIHPVFVVNAIIKT